MLETASPPTFYLPPDDIDESALEIGTVAMANVLLDYLRSN